MSSVVDSTNQSAFKYNEFISNNIFLICNPLFQHTNIKNFIYMRLFEDGKYLSLSHKLDYQNYFFNNIQGVGLFESSLRKTIEEEYNYFLWKFDKKDRISSGLYDFNIWNGISIYKRHLNFIDVYSFASDRYDDQMQNFYINNLGLLKRFILYFHEKSVGIIDFSPDKLAIFKDGVNIRPLENGFFVQEIEKFIQQTEIQRPPIRLKKGQLSLSKRESECLLHLSNGQTTKEIGRLTNLSHRTIEFYISNIKEKTGYRTKSELVKAFTKSTTELMIL